MNEVTCTCTTLVAGSASPGGGGGGGGHQQHQQRNGQQLQPIQIPDVKELPPEKVAAAIGDPAIQSVIGQPAMVTKMMSDPVIMSALRDPHITKAYMEFTRDPAEFAKYKVGRGAGCRLISVHPWLGKGV